MCSSQRLLYSGKPGVCVKTVKNETVDMIDKFSFRNSHSVCLTTHSSLPIDKVPINPRSSSQVTPSLPAMPHDMSVDIVSETACRKGLHRDMMTKNSNIFRRSESFETKFQVSRKLQSIGQIHCLKDPHEQVSHFINKYRDYVYAHKLL